MKETILCINKRAKRAKLTAETFGQTTIYEVEVETPIAKKILRFGSEEAARRYLASIGFDSSSASSFGAFWLQA